ncbi:uncharacterized protein LOC113338525 [Papaver somniferum]|uniref:uncharacterized protein LOC113338525 n=1 Tax=Papaver somniferum TaxID=3469 RepID=UPI000E6FAF1A|nr:uncharacterized protein LOC113338525 [Papaver somniferum]
MTVAEFTLSNLTVLHVVSKSTTVSEMISVVKQYWPYVPEDLVLFNYTVDGISHVINHDLELRFFIHYCISKGIDVLKFNIQFKICVDSVPPASSVGPSSSSSSCVSNNEVDIVEDLTDDFLLIKRVPKKSDAWANILTEEGQVFENKNDCRDTFKKYEFQSGYKTELINSDKKRYIVRCKNKESQNCSWRFHASVGANTNGVIDLSYSQAYHGLQFTKESLWGDDIKSYSDFIWYKESIERYNPGSVVNFEYDGVTKQFQRFFGAFEASIISFNKYCRPMLFIDCTFLTGNFKGGLIVACGKTEIYPVAFGIVPCENCESWEWFLTDLKGIISEDRPLTIISYRGAGLLKHVPVIFPKAHHSYYLYHMKRNIPVPKGKSRQTAVKLFEECYTALTKDKFYAAAKSMSNLKLDSVIDWMIKIPFQNWAAHAFQGERFGENTSNIAESFNSVIKHDKRLRVLELIDCIRAKVMDHIYKRLVESSKCTGKLTPRCSLGSTRG